MKVLCHIDQLSQWHIVLENIENLMKYEKENNTIFEIEIVANGGAVLGLIEHVAQKSKWQVEMEELYKKNVVFAACQNALDKFNPANSPLCDFVKVVPAGVVEIVQKQQEGYSYIKP